MQSSKYAPQPTAKEFIPRHPLPSQHLDTVGDSTGEFAQTRAPDDLFSDDFTPDEKPTVQQAAPTIPQASRFHRGKSGRGAHRGRGASANAHLSTQSRRHLDSEDHHATPAPVLPVSDVPTASLASIAPDVTRTEAVRGDRSRTGGLKQTKLTEDELTARMSAIKLKNVNLEAAHARAEADQASFHAHEAEAQEKRKQERQNRQQMMGEREKNRLRKLKAVGGREWDAEKGPEHAAGNEQDGRSQFRRGAYGGIVGSNRAGAEERADESTAELEEQAQARPGFREGGRGRGRGRGRGGADGVRSDRQTTQRKVDTEQQAPNAADFPPLAGQTTKTTKEDSAAMKPHRDWAEEMENSAVTK